MSKTKSIVILTVLAILIAFFGAASFVQFEIPNSTKDYMSIFGTIGKGIDLEGGYYAVSDSDGNRIALCSGSCGRSVSGIYDRDGSDW